MYFMYTPVVKFKSALIKAKNTAPYPIVFKFLIRILPRLHLNLCLKFYIKFTPSFRTEKRLNLATITQNLSMQI